MRTHWLLSPLCFLFLFTGCGNGLDNPNGLDDPIKIEMLFNGKDERSLSPFYSSGFDGYDPMGVQQVLMKHFFKEYYPDLVNDCAVVLNDTQLLKNYQEDGIVYQWPEIDFDKYSLLIGSFTRKGGTDVLLKDQRVVVSDGKATVYLKMYYPDAGFDDAVKNTRYFCALYTKLPNGMAEVIRWINE